MADSIEDLYKEIAVRHGIAVGKDDPIMILHTTNQLLIKDMAEAQRHIIEQFEEKIELMTSRSNEAVLTDAKRVLNATLQASESALVERLQNQAHELATEVRNEFDGMQHRIESTMKSANRIAIYHLVAAALTFMAAMTAFLTLYPF